MSLWAQFLLGVLGALAQELIYLAPLKRRLATDEESVLLRSCTYRTIVAGFGVTGGVLSVVFLWGMDPHPAQHVFVGAFFPALLKQFGSGRPPPAPPKLGSSGEDNRPDHVSERPQADASPKLGKSDLVRLYFS